MNLEELQRVIVAGDTGQKTPEHHRAFLAESKVLVVGTQTSVSDL